MPGTMTPKKAMKEYKGNYAVDKGGVVKIMPKGTPKGKKKAQYKYMGGKIDDANYASCGANIMRTK